MEQGSEWIGDSDNLKQLLEKLPDFTAGCKHGTLEHLVAKATTSMTKLIEDWKTSQGSAPKSLAEIEKMKDLVTLGKTTLPAMIKELDTVNDAVTRQEIRARKGLAHTNFIKPADVVTKDSFSKKDVRDTFFKAVNDFVASNADPTAEHGAITKNVANAILDYMVDSKDSAEVDGALVFIDTLQKSPSFPTMGENFDAQVAALRAWNSLGGTKAQFDKDGVDFSARAEKSFEGGVVATYTAALAAAEGSPDLIKKATAYAESIKVHEKLINQMFQHLRKKAMEALDQAAGPIRPLSKGGTQEGESWASKIAKGKEGHEDCWRNPGKDGWRHVRHDVDAALGGYRPRAECVRALRADVGGGRAGSF